MARFGRNVLFCAAVVGSASVARAQSAPWARTHVFTGIELSHDDQPITAVRPTIAAWGFLTDWTSVGVRVTPTYYRLADTASRTLTTAEFTLGQSVLQGRLSFDGSLGVIERSWGESTDGMAAARITAKPAPWASLSAGIEHFEYTSTEASLSTPVTPIRYTADALVSTRSGWMGEAQWQNTRFAGSGFVLQPDNNVTSAFGWVLAPIVRDAGTSLQAGYSFATQNSDYVLYTLANPAQRVPPAGGNFDLTGIYSPYYTPSDVSVHSALAALTVNEGARVTFKASGAYGFHASEQAPHITSVTSTPRGNAVGVVLEQRAFSPWNVRASVTSAVSRSASLVFAGEMLHTAFYTAQTLNVSLDYTLGR